jgi:hypothetical protein
MESCNYQLAGSKPRKEKIARKILEQLPGRCLVRNDYDIVYRVLSDAEAVSKIKQAFRDEKRKNRTTQCCFKEAVTENHVKEKKVVSSKEHVSMDTRQLLYDDRDMKKIIELCMNLSP